jgi:FkbM family methyltransferase
MRMLHRIQKASLTLANLTRRGLLRPVPDFNDEDLERAEIFRDYPIGTVIDVGAHVGEFARAVRHALPNADIYSVEPQPSCIPLLSAVPGITVLNVAAGEEDGTVHFEQNAFTACSSVLPLTAKARGAFPYTAFRIKRIEVPVRRLDGIIDAGALKRDILLKIDVQGYEDRVLRGAPVLLSHARFMLIEASLHAVYEGQLLAPELRAFLEGRGFRYVRTIRQMLHTFTGEPMQEDWLFERA